jgi:hypothetical protein
MSLAGKYDYVLIHSVIDPGSLPAFTEFLIEMSSYIVAPKNEHSDAVQRVAFYGFGDIHFRICVFRLLQTCFRVEWYWSAETQPNRWEMLVHIPTRHNITAAHLERFCTFCRNGISCDVIERGVNNGLVVFLDRIDKGRNHSGWMRHRLRIACDRHRERMLMQEERERIRNETGMDFTTSNMLYFYHEWQNTRIDLEALRETHRDTETRNTLLLRRIQEETGLITSFCGTIVTITEHMSEDVRNQALAALNTRIARINDINRQIASMSSHLRNASTTIFGASAAPTPLDRLLIVVGGSDDEDSMVIQ